MHKLISNEKNCLCHQKLNWAFNEENIASSVKKIRKVPIQNKIKIICRSSPKIIF